MLKRRSTNRRLLFRHVCCQAIFCLALPASAQDVQHVTLTPDGRFVVDGAATFPVGYTSGPVLGSLSPAHNTALAHQPTQASTDRLVALVRERKDMRGNLDVRQRTQQLARSQ